MLFGQCVTLYLLLLFTCSSDNELPLYDIYSSCYILLLSLNFYSIDTDKSQIINHITLKSSILNTKNWNCWIYRIHMAISIQTCVYFFLNLDSLQRLLQKYLTFRWGHQLNANLKQVQLCKFNVTSATLLLFGVLLNFLCIWTMDFLYVFGAKITMIMLTSTPNAMKGM